MVERCVKLSSGALDEEITSSLFLLGDQYDVWILIYDFTKNSLHMSNCCAHESYNITSTRVEKSLNILYMNIVVYTWASVGAGRIYNASTVENHIYQYID